MSSDVKRVPVTDVPSIPYRTLEVALLVFPLLLAAPLLLGGRRALGLLLGGLFVAGLLAPFVVAVLLFVDARKVRAQRLDWQPRPLLYVVLGFLFSGLTVLHYLYRRQEYVVDRETFAHWWLVAPVCLGLAVLVGLAGQFLSLPVPVSFGASALALAFVPLSLYRDAAYVRLHSAFWQPNPVMQFTVALVCSFLVVPLPFYLVYHLYKRHTALGTP